MMSRKTLSRSLLVTMLVSVALNTCKSSELSESMRLYFRGDFQSTHDRLTRSIAQGNADARSHYFRGLASYQLGNLAAAEADFVKGAQLEIKGATDGVGLALQRVQGIARLHLEKHRRLEKLKVPHRKQPTAPRPLAVRPVHRSQVPGIVQGLRLASEVPRLVGPLSDPFHDDPAGTLFTDQVASVDHKPMDDRPVGTGVAEPSAIAEVEPGDTAAENPFGDFGDVLAGNDFPIPTGPSVANKSGSKTLGIFGAVFRALGRATIPQVDARSIVPGIPGIGGGDPGSGGPLRL